MTHSCALDPNIAMCFLKLALEADTSKTETQQREELHIGKLQSTTRCSSSASVSVGKSINNDSLFSTETKTKCQCTSDQVQFLHHMCVKKLQKLIEKHVREHLRTQFTAREKKNFKDNFCKKTILSKFQ